MSSRRALGSHLAIAAIAAIAAASVASGDTGRKPGPARVDPLALLKRILAADDRVSYSARQTVVLSTEGRAEATVTDEVNYGYARGRIAYVLPESARGRVIIRNGSQRWTVEPTEKAVITSEVVHRPSSPVQIQGVAAQVARSYTLSVSPEPAYVAGRRTTVLTMTPKHHDRQRRVWWVDNQTALVLKREVYSASGKLEQMTSLGNLKINVPLNRAALKPAIPAGYRVVERPEDRVATDIDAARKLHPSFRDVPADLASGFLFQTAPLVDANGAKSLHAQYSDGLAGLSLFKIPVKTRMSSSSRARVVSIGSANGSLISTTAPYHILTWEAAGATFNLVSDISEETIIAVARSIRF